ncbi:RAxF-45 family protein [Pseudalkalibacillus caeni]|nr:RAxF-45 family protein [Pseudalkalibacillus caeni]
MIYSVARTQFIEFLHICRAIFHDAVVDGRSMPFFNNCIMTTEW